MNISKQEAREMVSKWKTGVTPLDLAHHIDVGRERWNRGMAYYFDGAAEGGESKVRFICGRYGNGKTHLMAMARHFAFERNVAVSYVNAEDVRMDRFEEIYRKILRAIEAKSITGKGTESLFATWKAKVTDPNAEEERLRAVQGMDLNFRTALVAYLKCIDTTEQDQILKWLQGDPVSLPTIGLKTAMRKEDGRDMMRSLSLLLRYMGYGGLLVLIDELDRIQNLPKKKRTDCYQVLRELMDNTDGAGGTVGALFYCAAPTEMFVGGHGFAEYDALKSRLDAAGLLENRDLVDYRGTIIDLDRTPLAGEDLLLLGKRVRDIHAISLALAQDEALPDAAVEEIVGLVLEKHYDISPPRLICASVATASDLHEQHGSHDARSAVTGAYEKAKKKRAEAQSTSHED